MEERFFDNPSTTVVNGSSDIFMSWFNQSKGHVTLLKRCTVAGSSSSVTIQADAILEVPSSIEFVVGGDMFINGQYDGIAGKLTFNGTSPQSFDNSPAGAVSNNFGEVTFNNPSTVTVSGSEDMTVRKSRELTGHVTLVKRLIAPGSTGTVTVDAGAVLEITSTGELSVGGR